MTTLEIAHLFDPGVSNHRQGQCNTQVDVDLLDWLDEMKSRGYKKGSIINGLLRVAKDQMDAQDAQKINPLMD
jgi:hypothetical protein